MEPDPASMYQRLEDTRRHVHDQRNQLQSLEVRQAVQQQMLERHTEEMNSLRSENEIQYERMNNTLTGFQSGIQSLIASQSTREGEENARARWIPIAISLLGVVVAALSVALAYAIGVV